MGANLLLLGDNIKKNDRNAAKEYYQKALQIFAEDRNIDKKYWIFGTLAKTAREENDLLQLAAYQDSMLNTFQKMNNLSSNRTIELLKIEYETDKKNQQIKNQGIQLRGQQITLLLIGTISLLILIALYLYFQNRDRKNQLRMAEQDRKVSVMVIEAEQNERSRIARDLHDSVSQKLAVMKMHLSMVETAQTESMDKINSMLQQTITEVRAISHNLYPRDLEKGIIPALELLCEQHNFVNSDINFSLHTDASVATSRLSKNIELVIYRIVQEITTNTLKYSGAKQVRIELSVHNGTITIRIADDGIGFNPESPDNAKGIGLKNITERIKQISGKITIRSKEEEGTQFHIEIPT
jgi:signal transduction histidine kinase